MKLFFGICFLIFSTSLFAQSSEQWFHLEGVSNPQYNVYLNENSIDYVPGVTITVDLKYKYFSDSLLNYSISKVKFLVSKDAYQVLSNRNFFIDKDERRTESVSESINYAPERLIPASEMSVIYQGVYIYAVSNYRPKSK